MKRCAAQHQKPHTGRDHEQDPTELVRLVRQFEKPVFGFLGRMGFSQPESEELAQEVFLRVWRNWSRYDPARGAVSTWIFTIARNLAINEIHRKKRHPVGNVNNPDDYADHTGRSDPVASLEAAEQIEQLRNALLALNEQDRTAIALVYIEQLSQTDAARIADCSAATFRTRLSRARQRLSRVFSSPQDSHDKSA